MSLYEYCAGGPTSTSDSAGLSVITDEVAVSGGQAVEPFGIGGTPTDLDLPRPKYCSVFYVRVSMYASPPMGHSWVETPRGNYGWGGGYDTNMTSWGGNEPDVREAAWLMEWGIMEFGPAKGSECCEVSCDEAVACLPSAAADFVARDPTWRPPDPAKDGYLNTIVGWLSNPDEPPGGRTCITFADYILEKCCFSRHKPPTLPTVGWHAP